MAGTLSVVSLGNVHRGLLELAAATAAQHFELVTVIDPGLAEPQYAFNPTRKQHNASAIVRKLGQAHLKPGRDAILALGHIDLFEPEMDYVIGDGDRDFRAAVVGLSRLRDGRDDERFTRRVQLMSLWGAGQAIGLRSCDDARCVMNLPERADDLDRRSGGFCAPCKQQLIKNAQP
ncbi:peptidase M54 [Vulgatibacter sp.]|uniref:peptidase M54 n=1 Tax=Vulgatibacter sp. TaxID=1971226 RepID=UPI003566F290